MSEKRKRQRRKGERRGYDIHPRRFEQRKGIDRRLNFERRAA